MKSTLLLPLASILIAATAHAQSPAPAPAASPPLSTKRPVEMTPSGTPGRAVTARTLRITATVYAIDVPTRIVTLQHDMGGVETLKVGPAVKNLERFAVGDTVVIDYEQGLALEFQPAGSEFVPPTEIAVGTRDDRGQLSAGTAGTGMRSTVTVVKINAAKRLVTLQGPGGNVVKVKAGPRIQLEKLEVGDKLLATYVEAVAITLEKAKK